MKKETREGVIKIDSGKPGNTLAIFCGIHGNEKAGIETVNYLNNNLFLNNGCVYLVYGNPKAIKQNVRYIEKNLNRCFLEESKKADSFEERRAVELMCILDECDALLDLHAYNEPYSESVPFSICESNCFDIVRNFELKYILTNIDNIEKGGTDAYMNSRGKIGICVELGSIEGYEEFIPLGIKTSYQFLQYFKMVDEEFKNDNLMQTKLRFSNIYKKKNNDFSFTKRYSTFDLIKRGEGVCMDSDESVVYQKDKYILFPRDNYEVGVEAFILAEDI